MESNMPVAAHLRTPRVTIGEAFTRVNSLNLIRLVLAASVIVSHAWPLGGFGDELRVGVTTVGTIAVASFFGISGFLITGSRERTSGGRYLWHRALRIFPGYAVCLVLIATVAAPLAWLQYNGTFSGYPVGDAARYVLTNLGLYTHLVPTITGTQVDVPADLQYWNGAAWSLFFEFLCYLAVALLAAFGALRVRAVAVIFASATVLLAALEVAPGPMNAVLFHSHDAYRLVTTGVVFSAGALLWLLRHRVTASPWLAGAASAVSAVGLLTLKHPHWLIAAPVAYLMIWLGARLRLAGLIKRTDISYGTYIYGYPVATLLAIWGGNRWGVWVYMALTFAIVIPLALASWHLVERRALALKDFRSGRAPQHETQERHVVPEGVARVAADAPHVHAEELVGLADEA